MLQTSSLGLFLSSLCAIGQRLSAPSPSRRHKRHPPGRLGPGRVRCRTHCAQHVRAHHQSVECWQPTQLAWSASLVGTIYATPIVVAGRVYIGGGDGRMLPSKPCTGAAGWTSRKRGPSTSIPPPMPTASSSPAPSTPAHRLRCQTGKSSGPLPSSPILRRGHGRRARPLRGRLRGTLLCPRYANRRASSGRPRAAAAFTINPQW